MTTFHCEYAWLGGDRATPGVLLCVEKGRIIEVRTNVSFEGDPADDTGGTEVVRLPGLTMPGLANTHSHVFHRAIRGHSQSGVADFWRWRDRMYSVAARLDPDLLYTLARATYAEMALSGITAVGEFHYVHHRPHGSPYADPNEMSRAVIRAANDAGIRITMLDTCYLQADVRGAPLEGVQLRFGDGSWQQWAERVDQLADSLEGHEHARAGAAIHSVRAVPREAMRPIGEHATRHGWPLHVHLSEQPAENEAALEVLGATPTQVLKAEGILGAGTTAVHATHLTPEDIEALGSSRTFISMCCTTERDLADGVGPAVSLKAAGSPLCVGSDAHMMIDLWEEARAIELDERLISGSRGHLSVADLARAVTEDGHASIGWPEAGRLAPGALADFVTMRLDSPRTAGARSGDVLAHVIFAATAADVVNVIVGGRQVVADGRHVDIPNVGAALEAVIQEALP